MAETANPTKRPIPLDPALAIYHLSKLNCEAIVSKYCQGDQIPIRNHCTGTLKFHMISGKAEIIEVASSGSPNPDKTKKTIAETCPTHRIKIVNSGEWCEIEATSRQTLNFLQNSHCIEFWFE